MQVTHKKTYYLVGAAMASGGTALAIMNADLAVLNDDLGTILAVIEIAKACRRLVVVADAAAPAPFPLSPRCMSNRAAHLSTPFSRTIRFNIGAAMLMKMIVLVLAVAGIVPLVGFSLCRSASLKMPARCGGFTPTIPMQWLAVIADVFGLCLVVVASTRLLGFDFDAAAHPPAPRSQDRQVVGIDISRASGGSDNQRQPLMQTELPQYSTLRT